MEFKHSDERIYLKNDQGQTIAEITFHPRPDGAVVLDHTYVDDCLRGQGVAGKLVQAAVDRLKAEGKPIAATCSYAVGWMEKHPEQGPFA